MVKQDVSDEYLFDLVDRLLSTYEDFIEEDKLEFILLNAIRARKEETAVDIIEQTYDEVGVLSEEKNSYNEFIDMLDNNFGLEKNIIEVGGGLFGRLGKRIAARQRRGTIKIYDPELIITPSTLQNITQINDCFKRETPTDNCQLIIGFRPCQATEIILEQACKNNIDFQIVLCPCSLPRNIDVDDYSKEESIAIYKKHLLDRYAKMVKDSDLGTLEIMSFKEIDDNNPIIYNKRKS